MPEFAQPGWLFLLFLVPVVFTLGFRTGVRGHRRRVVIVSLLRCLVLVALIAGLAGPLKTAYSRHTDVVFVLDISKSIDRTVRSEAINFIRQAFLQRREGARLGLVVFGANASVEVIAESGSKIPPEIVSKIEGGGTDISQALEVAIGALPTGTRRRIVLLSDGNENQGKAQVLAAVARSIDIEVYAIPLEHRLVRDEVRVEGMVAPASVHVHEPFKLEMALYTSKAMKAELLVTRNGAILTQSSVNLEPGNNAYAIVDQMEEGGLYEYEVIVSSDDDNVTENNRYQVFVEASGQPRVLLVSNDRDPPLGTALRAQGFEIDEIHATDIPSNRHELARYALIILNNVPALDMSLAKMTLLERFVRDGGGGLISIGGDKSYAAGGYIDTPVERLLPVAMDLKSQRNMPSLTLIIVLDRSGSMSSISRGEAKLSIAKRAALEAIDVLNPKDRVGILAFDANFEWTITPTEVEIRRQFSNRLRALEVGGGTRLFPALLEAYRVAGAERTMIRHVIVLSDGLIEDKANFVGLSRRMSDEGITVSTVALGSDSNRELLARIAAVGKGRSYYTDDPQNVPKIFTSEAMVVARDLVVEKEVRPVLSASGGMLTGFESDGFPPLLGYQQTEAKPAAQVLLVGQENQPLMAAWRYGLGRSVSFMSDMSGRWSRHWLEWPEYARFAGQLAHWAMRPQDAQTLLVAFHQQGRVAEVIVDAIDKDERFINGLKMSGTAVAPDQSETLLQFTQVAPGQYRSTLETPQSGRYYVTLSGASADVQVGPRTLGLAVPYSAEYNNLDVNFNVLNQVADLTGGRVLPLTTQSIEKVIEQKPGEISERFKVWQPFFILALLVLLIEIAIRKIARIKL